MSRTTSGMIGWRTWRLFLALAMLLLLPTARLVKTEDTEDDERTNGEENEEDDNSDEDIDDEDQNEKTDSGESGQKVASDKPRNQDNQDIQVTRTTKRRSLECYVCAYKAETPLRSCLDPAKYRVHTISCHNMEDSCFTSVLNKRGTYDAVVRGCRSGCVSSSETTCCEVSRCNNQAFAMPAPAHPRVEIASTTTKTIPPTVLYFVTVLLLLQTVVKVAFV